MRCSLTESLGGFSERLRIARGQSSDLWVDDIRTEVDTGRMNSSDPPASRGAPQAEGAAHAPWTRGLPPHPDDKHLVLVTRRAWGYEIRNAVREVDGRARAQTAFSEDILETWPVAIAQGRREFDRRASASSFTATAWTRSGWAAPRGAKWGPGAPLRSFYA